MDMDMTSGKGDSGDPISREDGGDTIPMNQKKRKCIDPGFFPDKPPMVGAGDKSILASFESGHYKKITGTWKGDSVWGHYYKSNGKMVHINLSKVEYLEEL